MAESAVSSASKWIGKMVVEEVKYLDQVTENIEELQAELEWMLCFLQDADQQRHRKAVVQKWVSQIKEHAYDAEDVIDKYMAKVSERTMGGSKKLLSMNTVVRYLCILRNWSALREVGSEMDVLTLKISRLSKRLQRYGLLINNGNEDGLLATQVQKEIGRTYGEDPTEDFVIGIDDDISVLVSRLQSERSEEKVIALIGKGPAKTTLARKVYNHDDVQRHFVAFSWVHAWKKVHSDITLRSIFEDLTRGVEESDEAISNMIKEENFKCAVYAVMQRRNCLVVLDELWRFSDFKELQVAFPKKGDKTGSRVLVTSRNVATIEGVYVHRPEGHDIVKLFNETFGTLPVDDYVNEKKKKLIKEMLGYCGGNPVAISSLAAVLKRKQKVEEWETVRNNLSFTLKKDFNVYDVISVSISNMPPHFKPFFFHLANFPEDYQIQADVLFKIWSAEGLITLPYNNPIDTMNPDISEEDVADGYLNELELRSLIQVVKREKSSGRIKTLQLHDLVREVCVSKAMEEGFLFRVKNIYVNSKTRVRHARGLRRLAVHAEGEVSSPVYDSEDSQPQEAVHKKLFSAPGLRSLIIFYNDIPNHAKNGKRHVKDICKDFPLLRVLEFKDCNISESMPKELGNLIHLRYLGLYNTRITKLPTSIANLKSLQTLDLRVANTSISVPNVLWLLKLLKHLYLPELKEGWTDKTIQGGKMLRLDELMHLETLWHIDLDRTDVRGLRSSMKMKSLVGSYMAGKIQKLRPFIHSQSMKEVTLSIHTRVIMEDSKGVLSRTKLVDAYIYDPEYNVSDGFCGLKLEHRMLPQCIVRLNLKHIKFEEDPMPVLGDLENLKSLKIGHCRDLDSLRCSQGSFPTLTFLLLAYLGDYEWNVEGGAFPRLKRLELSSSSRDAIRWLPKEIDPTVWVTCLPCINGLENQQRPCPHAKELTASNQYDNIEPDYQYNWG